jgi:hypothetical protein
LSDVFIQSEHYILLGISLHAAAYVLHKSVCSSRAYVQADLQQINGKCSTAGMSSAAASGIFNGLQQDVNSSLFVYGLCSLFVRRL